MSSSQWPDSVFFYKLVVGSLISNRRRHSGTCPPANGVTPSSSTSSLLGLLHSIGGGMIAIGVALASSTSSLSDPPHARGEA